MNDQEALERDCSAYLNERQEEFIRTCADGSTMILEVELDRLVAQFLRGVNRLN